VIYKKELNWKMFIICTLNELLQNICALPFMLNYKVSKTT